MIEEKVSFALAVVFGLLYLLFSLLDFSGIADSLRNFIPLFVLAGTLQMVIVDEFNIKTAKISGGKELFFRARELIVKLYGLDDFSCRKFQKKFILAARIFLTVLAAVFLVLIIRYLKHGFDYRDLQPRITVVEPRILYPSNKILIQGKRFVSGSSGPTRVMMEGVGEVQMEAVGEEEIIVEGTIFWPVGDFNLWVEKPVVWDHRPMVFSSLPAPIKVLPRPQNPAVLSPDDFLFLKQLKSLSPKAREVNEY